MKRSNKKIKALILAVILFIISIIVIILNGKTYTIKINNANYAKDFEKLEIVSEDENISQIVDKKVENELIKVKVKSLAKGRTYVTLKKQDDDTSMLFSLYVHRFGVISFNEFMGDCNCSLIIPISIIIWLCYVLFLFIDSYKQSVKENMYQYKNIAYLGIIIFLIAAIISQISLMFNYHGLINTIDSMINMFSFSMGLFVAFFFGAIIVIISNISLMKKEGFHFRNMLGIILGVIIIILTILPDLTYQWLFSASWIDIHNQNGIGLYLYELVEALLNITTTYVECVLIGTIIMGIKAAKYIPKFDKDYIMILGCQIKKDGTLTNLLKGRVDRAIEFAKMQKEKAGKDISFVPSGGKGNDEIISEAQAMKNYLLEQGIKEENILLEDKSTNTFENIKFSNKLIKEKIENAKIAFSTTNYHVLRAGSIATEQGLLFEGIGAKTKSYFWINAFIREFVATMVSEKRKHIAVICGIIIATIMMIAITYLNNNV